MQIENPKPHISEVNLLPPTLKVDKETKTITIKPCVKRVWKTQMIEVAGYVVFITIMMIMEAYLFAAIVAIVAGRAYNKYIDFKNGTLKLTDLSLREGQLLYQFGQKSIAISNIQKFEPGTTELAIKKIDPSWAEKVKMYTYMHAIHH